MGGRMSQRPVDPSGLLVGHVQLWRVQRWPSLWGIACLQLCRQHVWGILECESGSYGVLGTDQRELFHGSVVGVLIWSGGGCWNRWAWSTELCPTYPHAQEMDLPMKIHHGEFDRRVDLVVVLEQFGQWWSTMVPDHENVIYKSQP